MHRMARDLYEKERDQYDGLDEFCAKNGWNQTLEDAYRACGMAHQYRSDQETLAIWNRHRERHGAQLKKAHQLGYWAPLASTIGGVACGLGLMAGPIMAAIAVFQTVQAEDKPWKVVPRAVITLAVTAVLVVTLLADMSQFAAVASTRPEGMVDTTTYRLWLAWGAFALLSWFFHWFEGTAE